jgi:hypothetical protein
VGALEVWLDEEEHPPFRIPAYFPDVPEERRPLLGLSGVINQLRWTFDGTPHPDEPYGVLLLEDIRRT